MQLTAYKHMNRVGAFLLSLALGVSLTGCWGEEESLRSVRPTEAVHHTLRPITPTVRAIQPTLVEASGLSSNSQSEERTLETTAAPTETQAVTQTTPPARDLTALDSPYDALPYAYDAKVVKSVIEGAAASPYEQPLVFLTFDDGVNPVSTPKILDVLKQEQVHGTFFVIGRTLFADNAWIIQRIQNEGNALALHSFNHDYDCLYPGRIANPKEIGAQADQTQAALQQILGGSFHTKVWRYPGGHMSWGQMDPADKALADRGIVWIDWNAMGGMADIPKRRPKDAPGVLSYMIDSMRYSPTRSIYVVLLHDTADKPLIPEALPLLIRYFRENGYSFGVLK